MTNFTEDIYWEDADYVKWDRKLFSEANLNLGDIRALCELGLPEWVAPNINFDKYEVETDFLKLGEDKYDRDIVLNFKSCNVLTGHSQQLINSSPFHLRKALQLYAIMIEKAILLDDEAFVENRVDTKLILELEGELAALDPECVSQGTFWAEELSRLNTKV